MSTIEEKPKGTWGGRRAGAGGKPLTDEERLRRRNARDEDAKPLGDPVEEVAQAIGLSPRVAKLRPDLAERYEVVSPGEHFARFCETYLRHHQRVPGGPPPGSPFELVEYQREFFDEALEVDDQGSREWSTAVMVIPRKNGKTTINSALATYFCSPADGEEMPEVILAAAAKKQAGKLYDHARTFIDHPRYSVPELRRLFLAGATEIRCPAMGGKIERVAGDGDNDRSLDPSVVIADQLHTWSTPKQCENWRALTTADGSRLDPLVVGISTEGADDDNELARLLERVTDGATTEVEHRRAGLTIYRDRESRILIYVYAISSSATLHNLDEFVQANPAPWRTRERIAQDLANRRNDEPTRLRLYGNRRGAGAGRWIADDKIDQLIERGRGLEIPVKAGDVVVAVDGAISRDTTACSWSWRHASGVIVQRSRVWSCREDRPHDVFVPGGRLDNDLVRDFILEQLVPKFGVELVFYDERTSRRRPTTSRTTTSSASSSTRGRPRCARPGRVLPRRPRGAAADDRAWWRPAAARDAPAAHPKRCRVADRSRLVRDEEGRQKLDPRDRWTRRVRDGRLRRPTHRGVPAEAAGAARQLVADRS